MLHFATVYFRHLRNVLWWCPCCRSRRSMPLTRATTGRSLISRFCPSCLSAARTISWVCIFRWTISYQNTCLLTDGSTETAMLKGFADAYITADTGHVTLFSLLYLGAAFDTVDHSILVERLRRSSGIVGRALDWLKSYLTGRSQFVHFNGEVSATTPVTVWLVLSLPGHVPVMSAIRDKLHWLSYPQRVTFKLCLTTYKCLYGLAPPYLTRFCTPLSAVAGRTHLRSADQRKLFVPRTSTSTFGSRAFSSLSPLSWNALPPQLRDPAISISIFRQSLKTLFFNNNPDWLCHCYSVHLLYFLGGSVTARTFVTVSV